MKVLRRIQSHIRNTSTLGTMLVVSVLKGWFADPPRGHAIKQEEVVSVGGKDKLNPRGLKPPVTGNTPSAIF